MTETTRHGDGRSGRLLEGAAPRRADDGVGGGRSPARRDTMLDDEETR
jgi:hypothetical protein